MTIKPVDKNSAFGSQAAAEDYLRQLINKDPNLHEELHVVSDFEVAAP